MPFAILLIVLGGILVLGGIKGYKISDLLIGNITPSDSGGGSSSGTSTTTDMSTTKGSGLVEAFYDPLGSFDNGKFGGPIGGHSNHVHLSITNPTTMLEAIQTAQNMGLSVQENPYVGPVHDVHVGGSYHYRDFPGKYNGKTLGEAIDVSGPANLMAQYYKLATSNWAGK